MGAGQGRESVGGVLRFPVDNRRRVGSHLGLCRAHLGDPRNVYCRPRAGPHGERNPLRHRVLSLLRVANESKGSGLQECLILRHCFPRAAHAAAVDESFGGRLQNPVEVLLPDLCGHAVVARPLHYSIQAFDGRSLIIFEVHSEQRTLAQVHAMVLPHAKPLF